MKIPLSVMVKNHFINLRLEPYTTANVQNSTKVLNNY
jgi:hypothetical protein